MTAHHFLAIIRHLLRAMDEMHTRHQEEIRCLKAQIAIRAQYAPALHHYNRDGLHNLSRITTRSQAPP